MHEQRIRTEGDILKQQPVLEARGLTKNFGKIQALRGIDFKIRPGEVVGLLGDNGAGKSTFIKVISGPLSHDDGELLLDNKPVRFNQPMEARNLGIETVYQDLALAPHLDIESNLFLGREIFKPGILGKLGFLDKKKMFAQAEKNLEKLGVTTIQDVSASVGDLSGGQRQAVAIARTVSWGSKLVILDEPTAALGVEQSAMVLDLIRQVKSKGIPVIFITHTLPFVFEVTDRIVILRLGKVVADLKTDETDINEVVKYITGSMGEKADRITKIQQKR
jgi:ABC-type sugar transport system ATPase subunit